MRKLTTEDFDNFSKLKLPIGDWVKFRENIDDEYFDYLKTKFGPDIIKPTPEDVGLDSNNMSEAQEVYAKNQKARAHNRRLNIARSIFGSILVPFDDKSMSSLGEKYANYIKVLSAYPGEEKVSEIKEKQRLLEIKRKETGYWFSLSGWEFEEEVSKLFQKAGCSSVVKTKGSGDGGIDLILTDEDGTKTLVQCKAHKKAVGPHVARDLYGAMQSVGISSGIIISLGGVTPGVRDFIKGKDISIIDVNGIIKFQKEVSEKK